MSLISLTQSAPIPFEPARGAEAVALFAPAPANVRDLIAGVAGCSPYLRGLIASEAEWLRAAQGQPPETVMADLRDTIGATGFDALGRELRRAKRRVALYVALADCGGMWPLATVTQALTDFADFAVQRSLDSLIRAEFERGRLPGCSAEDLETACGMVVLAMGKMGAGELNYSSDIDLIVLFDDTRIASENFEAVRTAFVRITKRLTKLLSEVTSEGYVFRTDLRLRPDPSVTPVCLSLSAAERYYESLGRTWERAAYIKARPCAGDIVAGTRFLDILRPFVWRKHLDYAAIQDAHDMRLRIRAHKGLGGPITLPGHDLKLGRGGIREIEFFTQTRQIIAGGRDPGLRTRGTLSGLRALVRKGWITDLVAAELSAAYGVLRMLEHRLQMVADAQTHALPTKSEYFARIAAFCGQADLNLFRAELGTRLDLVHSLTESFFAPGMAETPELPEMRPEEREQIEAWRRLPALRSERARGIFTRLQPAILARIHATAHPANTLNQFDGFLAGLPAGVQLFSLFEANPHLIDLLVDICGSAPGLARYLSRNAQIFDAVIGGTFFEPLPGVADLSAALKSHLEEGADYEDQLNAARRWMKEQHFRIGVQHLKAMINSDGAARHYSDLAEAVLRGLFPAVCAEFGKRHGPLPGQGAMVLGMGSLGARSLNAGSDLDLIVIYEAGDQAFSTGARPLAVSSYYARLTQALVTALSSPMAEGRLYEVDMRLRPSGRKGPVATPFSGFAQYQRTEAWTWEHLALTRARGVAGDAALEQKVETLRGEILNMSRDPDTVRRDVADMRLRLAQAAERGRAQDAWETKIGAGRMLDIELLAQSAALLAGDPARGVLSQLGCATRLGWIDDAAVDGIGRAYERLARLGQIGRLLVVGTFDPGEIGQDGRALLLAETNCRDLADLQSTLDAAAQYSATLIGDCLDVATG